MDGWMYTFTYIHSLLEHLILFYYGCTVSAHTYIQIAPMSELRSCKYAFLMQSSICLYMCACKYVHTCIHTYVHVNMYIHAYIHKDSSDVENEELKITRS